MGRQGFELMITRFALLVSGCREPMLRGYGFQVPGLRLSAFGSRVQNKSGLGSHEERVEDGEEGGGEGVDDLAEGGEAPEEAQDAEGAHEPQRRQA